MALEIVKDLDPGLRIVAAPKGRTTERWRGPLGLALVDLVDEIQDENGDDLSWKEVSRELEKMGFEEHKIR